jgi:hypothetical protein
VSESNPTTKQAWTLDQYKRWFDEKVNPSRREKVREVFVKLNREINNKAFEVMCDGANGENPAVYSKPNFPDVHAFVRKS